MRQREYEALCRAISRFMADDTGGWEDGMDIVDDLRRAHEREKQTQMKVAEAERG